VREHERAEMRAPLRTLITISTGSRPPCMGHPGSSVENDIPGSARKGSIDMRSTDANGKQADEVQSHAERAAA
jgi:hypothetical protein